ncbi:RHS repeat-associated core domain-containing protein [Saccharothrix sp. ALI-22-I]|uniref:RHS repeat-associated core domain-containing protein n=1 Tax=Saccharothrix sp. ALI-22-I TaxID=1933778 RepID=UPI001EE755B0
MIDPNGDLVWRARTTLWGQAPDGPAPGASCPLRFPGQYHDVETGLHHNYFRHYDPEAGRYASIDPLGLAGGLNPNWYVPNPFSWADPFGLALCRATPRMEDGTSKQGWKQADSTFTLAFALKKAKVETRHDGQVVDVSTADDFRAAALDGARDLHALGSAEVEEDRKPLDDLAAAIAKYESWQRSS